MTKSTHNRYAQLYAQDTRRTPRYHAGEQPWTITEKHRAEQEARGVVTSRLRGEHVHS